MKISWKVVYAFSCIVLLFLVPFVYADENVEVSFLKDGSPAQEITEGDILTLHSELVSANATDYIRYELQDSKLEFVENGSINKINVYGRFNGTVWNYDIKVKVLEEDPALPKGVVIRDSSQPDLSETEKPNSINLELNSEQIVAPGDTISAKVVLEPEETVNSNYYNYVAWSVTYGDNNQSIEVPRGESVSFQVPEDALNNKLKVQATLLGSECGLGENLVTKAVEIKVKDDSLSVQIFPSTDSEGIVSGQYIGFSSEILRNGKVAEAEISENSTYNWTAQIGTEFVNGQRENRTGFALRPTLLGTLSVKLKVTLSNGLELESNEVIKTVVDQSRGLESINLRLVENGDTTVGKEVEVTKELEPFYSTGMDEASYKWTVVQDGEVIAEQETAENLKFTPKTAGSVSVTLEIAVTKDAEPIKSEPLIINIIDPSQIESEPDDSTSPQPEEPDDQEDNNQNDQNLPTDNNSEETSSDVIHVISGEIQSNQETENIKIGSRVTVNALLQTQGTIGKLTYHWQAQDQNGKIINQSDQLEDFSFTSNVAGPVTVTLTARVEDHDENKTDSIEDESKKFELSKIYTFLSDKEVSLQEEKKDSQEILPPDNSENNSSGSKEEIPTEKNREQNKPGVTVESEKSSLAKPESSDQEAVKSDPVQESTKNDSVEPTKESDHVVETVKSNPVQETAVKLVETEKPETSTTTATQINGQNPPAQVSSSQTSSGVGTAQYSVTPLKRVDTGSYSNSGENYLVNDQKSKAGSSTSSLNTNYDPTLTSNTLTDKASTTGSVFTRTSNIENPQTGVDFTIGQIAVIAVCSLLIIASIITLLRRTVFHS